MLTWTTPAWAWDQYRTFPTGNDGVPQGCGIRWLNTEIPLALDVTALDGLDQKAVEAVAAASTATWQAVQCQLCPTCSNGKQSLTNCGASVLGQTFLWLPRGKPTEIGAPCTSYKNNGTCETVTGNGNWVNFIHDKATWQDQGVSTLVVALTVLTYDRNNGEIRDADVLLDDWDHEFCIAPACAPLQYDLESTLTHELGHALGLDHSADPESTMYAGADPGETKKQTLNGDDNSGICTVYRTTCDACAQTAPASGCQAGSAGAGWGILLLLAAWGTIRRARN